MKIKLDTKLAYLIGLWKARKTTIGLGVGGDEQINQIFIEKSAERLGVSPNNFKFEGKRVFFFHTAYRKYFQETEEGELDIFRRKNEVASAFLAGYFDGNGGIEGERNDRIYLSRAGDNEKALIERLGFKTVFRSGKLYMIKPKEFIFFIIPFISHPENKRMLGALVQSGNERDPRLQLRSGPPGQEHSVGTAYVK